MARGGKRPGAGRPRGSISRKASEQEREAVSGGASPLAFLVSVYRNEALPTDVRIDAAKAAAPYVHKKMPQQIDTRIDVTADDLVRRIKEGQKRARMADRLQETTP